MVRRLLSDSGITIIEVVLIVVIIAILHQMFVPRYSKDAILKHKVYSTAHDIAADLRYARRLAISGGPSGNPLTSSAVVNNKNDIQYWFEVYDSAGGVATDSWRIYSFNGSPSSPDKYDEVLSDIVIEYPAAATNAIYFDNKGRPHPSAGSSFIVRDTDSKYRWAVSVERTTGYVRLTEL